MASIVIVGVGALGSHLVQSIRNLGEVKVVDPDRVESKNELSQFHGRPGRDKLKVQALSAVMSQLWGVKLASASVRIVSDNVAAIVGKPDVAVDCMDNAEGRRTLQAYCGAAGIPLLHSAVSAGGDFGLVQWSPEFVPDEAAAGAPTCENGNALPFLMLTSAVAAGSLQKFLASGQKNSWIITPAGVKKI